jgi:hypothetical protein
MIIMACRATLSTAKPFTAANLLKKNLPTIIVTAFYLISFSGNSMATESTHGMDDILSGKISSVDISHRTKNLTLHADELGISADGRELNIVLNDNTTVLMCKVAKSIKDLKAGSKAVVMYHEVAGVAVADYIYEPC